jgi:hypothetical protein
VRKLLLVLAVLLVLGAGMLAGCGDDDGASGGAVTTATSGTGGAITTLPPVEPVTYEGDGDDTISITLPIPGAPAIATFTNTVAGPFVVDTVGTGGDVTTNLVDRIGTYKGTVPIDFNSAQEKTAGLQVQAPGPWTVELRAVRDVEIIESGSRQGDTDDVFGYAGPAQPGTFTFQGQGTAVVIAYPGLSGGFPDTLASLDGASPTPANIALPGNALIQVTAEGPWELRVGG